MRKSKSVSPKKQSRSNSKGSTPKSPFEPLTKAIEIVTVDGSVEGHPRDKHGRTRSKVDRARIAKRTLDVLDRWAAVSRRIDNSPDVDPEETPCDVAFALLDKTFHDWGTTYAVARELAACLVANASPAVLLEIESAMAEEESGTLAKLEEEIRRADAVALALGCDFSTAHGIVEAHSSRREREREADEKPTAAATPAATVAMTIARLRDELGEVEAALDALNAKEAA